MSRYAKPSDVALLVLRSMIMYCDPLRVPSTRTTIRFRSALHVTSLTFSSGKACATLFQAS